MSRWVRGKSGVEELRRASYRRLLHNSPLFTSFTPVHNMGRQQTHREVVTLVVCVQGQLHQVMYCVKKGVTGAQVGATTRQQQAVDGVEPVGVGDGGFFGERGESVCGCTVQGRWLPLPAAAAIVWEGCVMVAAARCCCCHRQTGCVCGLFTSCAAPALAGRTGWAPHVRLQPAAVRQMHTTYRM